MREPRPLLIALMLLAVMLMACGCQPNNSSSLQSDSKSQFEPSSATTFNSREQTTQHTIVSPEERIGVSPTTELGSEETRLVIGDRQTFDKLLEKNRGKVVLVDFWATWCAPCVEQFPHTVSLSKQNEKSGLAVIAVSMNEADEREQVQAFLKKQQANFDNLLTSYGAGAEFVDAFDLRGDVPFYRLYDKTGAIRHIFSGDPTGLENCEPVEMIDKRLSELLSE